MKKLLLNKLAKPIAARFGTFLSGSVVTLFAINPSPTELETIGTAVSTLILLLIDLILRDVVNTHGN